jgi:hypothetical protein
MGPALSNAKLVHGGEPQNISGKSEPFPPPEASTP